MKIKSLEEIVIEMKHNENKLAEIDEKLEKLEIYDKNIESRLNTMFRILGKRCENCWVRDLSSEDKRVIRKVNCWERNEKGHRCWKEWSSHHKI